MKNLALGALLAGFLAACGGGGDDIAVIDAPGGGDGGIDTPVVAACNPLQPAGQQGCATGEKCTWITVVNNPPPADDIGKLGCVMNGAAGNGEACTRGQPGETTGFDTCSAGNYCIDGFCRDICGFDGSEGAACATGFNCTRYSDTFANGDDDPTAGICKASCDPLTQTVVGGGTCPSGDGCYVATTPTTSQATCASASTLTHGMPITEGLFINSCAPGHTFRRTAQGATTYECTALCKPADVTSTTHMVDEGGVDPYTCESKGASPPDSATSGEYCQFYWAREGFTDLSPFSNTLGTCFKHAIYQYDANGDMTPETPWPRCTTLTTGDVIPPFGTTAMPDNDALDFACIAYPAALTGPQLNLKHLAAEWVPTVTKFHTRD